MGVLNCLLNFKREWVAMMREPYIGDGRENTVFCRCPMTVESRDNPA